MFSVHIFFIRSILFSINKLYFTYSHENSKNIRWGIVDPLPDPAKHYIFPRGNDRLLTDHDVNEIETRVEKFESNGSQMLRFYGNGSAGVGVETKDITD